ncbi:hypothetical protein [Dyella ginsengisoli]|uniref:hypothetical protein n=1 Tax=Dyella ginsengisoli TaxID=363848 RepID=UPI0012FD969B|nr:hypothetical protein [Dyella ginsengisoli]
MNFTDEILSAANHAGICSAYYRLCNEHQFVPGTKNRKVPYKDVLAAADGKIQLSKLPGPGTAFKSGGLPEGLTLNFIVQSGGSVEAHFAIGGVGHEQQGTFATLCNEALKQSGQPVPSPPYPRPICGSPTELVAAFHALQELAVSLFGALRGIG